MNDKKAEVKRRLIELNELIKKLDGAGIRTDVTQANVLECESKVFNSVDFTNTGAYIR